MKFKTIQEKYDLLELRDSYIRKLIVEGKSKDVATCLDMCSEKERYLRQIRQQISVFEAQEEIYSFPTNNNDMSSWLKKDTRIMDPYKAIKEYSRSAADQETSLPNELRPLDVLEYTMDFLITNVIEKADILKDASKYGEYYNFVWSRTRAIRKDITQQGIFYQGIVNSKYNENEDHGHSKRSSYNTSLSNLTRVVSDEIRAAAIIEKIARWHIFCSYFFCHLDVNVFDPKLNNEHLTKCLQGLKQLYSDIRAKITLLGPEQVAIFSSLYHEPEFQAYYILMNLELMQGDIIPHVSSFSPEVYDSPEIDLAFRLFRTYHNGNYRAFFGALRKELAAAGEIQERPLSRRTSPPISFLVTCLLHRYFYQVRVEGIQKILLAYKGSILFSLDWLAAQLFWGDRELARGFIQAHAFENEEGYVLAYEISNDCIVLQDPSISFRDDKSSSKSFMANSREPFLDEFVLDPNRDYCPVGAYVYGGDSSSYPPSLERYEPTDSFDAETGEYVGDPGPIQLFFDCDDTSRVKYNQSMASVKQSTIVKNRRTKSASPPPPNKAFASSVEMELAVLSSTPPRTNTKVMLPSFSFRRVNKDTAASISTIKTLSGFPPTGNTSSSQQPLLLNSLARSIAHETLTSTLYSHTKEIALLTVIQRKRLEAMAKTMAHKYFEEIFLPGVLSSISRSVLREFTKNDSESRNRHFLETILQSLCLETLDEFISAFVLSTFKEIFTQNNAVDVNYNNLKDRPPDDTVLEVALKDKSFVSSIASFADQLSPYNMLDEDGDDDSDPYEMERLYLSRKYFYIWKRNAMAKTNRRNRRNQLLLNNLLGKFPIIPPTLSTTITGSTNNNFTGLPIVKIPIIDLKSLDLSSSSLTTAVSLKYQKDSTHLTTAADNDDDQSFFTSTIPNVPSPPLHYRLRIWYDASEVYVTRFVKHHLLHFFDISPTFKSNHLDDDSIQLPPADNNFNQNSVQYFTIIIPSRPLEKTVTPSTTEPVIFLLQVFYHIEFKAYSSPDIQNHMDHHQAFERDDVDTIFLAAVKSSPNHHQSKGYKEVTTNHHISTDDNNAASSFTFTLTLDPKICDNSSPLKNLKFFPRSFKDLVELLIRDDSRNFLKDPLPHTSPTTIPPFPLSRLKKDNNLETPPSPITSSPLNSVNFTGQICPADFISCLVFSFKRQLLLYHQFQATGTRFCTPTVLADRLVEYLFNKICREPFRDLIQTYDTTNIELEALSTNQLSTTTYAWTEPIVLLDYFNRSVLPVLNRLVLKLILTETEVQELPLEFSNISSPAKLFVDKDIIETADQQHNSAALERVKQILSFSMIPDIAYFLVTGKRTFDEFLAYLQQNPLALGEDVGPDAASIASKYKLECIRIILTAYYEVEEDNNFSSPPFTNHPRWQDIALDIFDSRIASACELLAGTTFKSNLDLTFLDCIMPIPSIPLPARLFCPSDTPDMNEIATKISKKRHPPDDFTDFERYPPRHLKTQRKSDQDLIFSTAPIDKNHLSSNSLPNEHPEEFYSLRPLLDCLHERLLNVSHEIQLFKEANLCD